MSTDVKTIVALAKKLQNVSLATNTCPECCMEVEENKRNKETTISGLCTDCQKLYFHDEQIAHENNFPDTYFAESEEE